MRNRLQVHFKALTFSLSAVGALLFLAFFFYDGPLELSITEPVAQAREANPLLQLVQADAHPKSARDALSGILPVGFKPHWQQVSLDRDHIHLKMLKTPFLLSQTHHQSGREAFQYASYLFDQMAHGVASAKLSDQMRSLSLQAQNLGNAIAQAESIQFSGPPTSDMDHLQVRSSILYYLSGLNPQPLVSVQYNERGKILAQSTSAGDNGGEDIDAFTSKVDALMNQPEAQAYPETMRLLKQESALLKQVANHMTLRWESTRDCPRACGNVAVYLRVYAHQTLPGQTQAAVTI